MATTHGSIERDFARELSPTPIRRTLIGAVLAATDGSPASDGAMRIGHLLAMRDGVPFRVLPVLEPVPYPVSRVLPGWAESSENTRKEILQEHVKEQLQRVTGSEPAALPEVEFGRPADVITRVAHAEAIALAVAGLHRHGYVGQTIGEETILEVMREAALPVLAATDDAPALPRRVMVAMDFSHSSVRAARAAFPLVAEGGVITLVHVQPSVDYFASAGPAWDSIYSSGVSALLDRLCRELAGANGVQVTAEVVTGEPASRLIEFAHRGAFDLVAAGSHGPGLIERLLVGSVATRLVRGVECSVLVAPARSDQE